MTRAMSKAEPKTRRTDEQIYGTRSCPRNMLTPVAAIELAKESGHAMWVRFPMYEATFHIYPGGRKVCYPDKDIRRVPGRKRT
jgi:hypothetical protein